MRKLHLKGEGSGERAVGGGGVCENLIELSMCDAPIETVEYI